MGGKCFVFSKSSILYWMKTKFTRASMNPITTNIISSYSWHDQGLCISSTWCQGSIWPLLVADDCQQESDQKGSIPNCLASVNRTFIKIWNLRWSYKYNSSKFGKIEKVFSTRRLFYFSLIFYLILVNRKLPHSWIISICQLE